MMLLAEHDHHTKARTASTLSFLKTLMTPSPGMASGLAIMLLSPPGSLELTRVQTSIRGPTRPTLSYLIRFEKLYAMDANYSFLLWSCDCCVRRDGRDNGLRWRV